MKDGNIKIPVESKGLSWHGYGPCVGTCCISQNLFYNQQLLWIHLPPQSHDWPVSGSEISPMGNICMQVFLLFTLHFQNV